jgi:hypothetical protein
MIHGYKRRFVVQNIRPLSIVSIVIMTLAAAPVLAQTVTPTTTPPTPSPTATQTATVVPPTATPTGTPPVPTPTPTPPTAAVSFDESNLTAGEVVTASGSANDGPYCLAMVSAGVFSIGSSYGGTPVSSVDLSITGGSFSGVIVNNSAPAGQFDLLLLLGPCSTATIITAGDNLGAGSGLDVASAAGIPSVSRAGGFAILSLIAAAGIFLLWRRG